MKLYGGGVWDVGFVVDGIHVSNCGCSKVILL